MSEQKQYRYLNEGEFPRPGDDYYEYPNWKPRTTDLGSPISSYSLPHRRPIEPAGWPEAISKYRYYPTEQDCDGRGYIMGFTMNVWMFMTPGQFKEGNYAFWMKCPPAPKPIKPDWEVAWEAYKGNNYYDSGDEERFKAGYLAAQQKGKG